MLEESRTRARAQVGASGAQARRRVLAMVGNAGFALIGPTDPGAQRQDVIRRAFIAGVIVATLPIQRQLLPGWQGVVAGCAVALVYDVFLGYLVFVKQRFALERVLGVIADALVLMGASLYVFRQMGAGGSASDIWLVFMVYVVTGGFTLAPLGSVLYTALWIGWFALGTLLYFPASSIYHQQLLLRLIFMGTIGLSALGMANELEKRRARLAQQHRQTMGMLAKLVEARDTDAGAHLRSIQHFSRALARSVGLSEREADEIAYASMVHDVGKANVPDAILKKPGPLSTTEWHTMREHTNWGDELLNENVDFEFARQVARWHHEHWDGGGYPDGLAGEAIPFAARIVAVADVYDALISKRPYKDAWPPEAAFAELKNMAGSHLDPELVAAFGELWETGTIAEISAQIHKDQHESEARAA